MKAAWNALPTEEQARLKPMLDEAHGQLGDYLKTGQLAQPRFRPLLRLKSFLIGDWDGHNQRLLQQSGEAGRGGVGPRGEILGTGKFQEFDPFWELLSGTVWLENLLHKHPFPPGAPNPVLIPDVVTIAMVSDFGTGNFGAGDSPSTKISKFIPRLNPHITIHLGDVYYAGTSAEQSSRFTSIWPRGSFGSFALNSNHDMYCGGGPYFNEVVGGPVFNTYQSPYSFFALENSNWMIIGLDSAYHADVLTLYLDGSLGDSAQLPFLRSLAQRAAQENKKVILLTHHNGIPETGIQSPIPLRLSTEVSSAFEGTVPPAYWFWGHVHAGIAYKPLANGTLCRCIGHGALPWGFANELQNDARVAWFETCSANDPENKLRVLNGFAVLQLDGPNLAETFYDEDGRVAWTPEGGDPRNCPPEGLLTL
ncbi:hypothetical protein ACPOL_1300 [Acidisarcina polymorpha]|uniref:Calcineurin-like phosphoesterase domain-containing protein n=2 Tax=Acidisarcina polymorpha TaxID=2211140 RepID=A0A2Z5FUU7_9BACT|nr:hypothetical protein ACPOL_1300 [Acidisarcina polymorpha]